MSTVTEQSFGRQVRLTEQRESRSGATTWSESAFRDVFLEHYGRVVGVLFRLVGDRSRAEELASEAFWKLYRQPMVPEPEGNLGGWLYRTATNLGIDALRAASRRDQYEQAAGQAMLGDRAGSDPLDETLRAERRERVRTVLATLKPAQSQILVLRSTGFAYKELAEILGASLGSIGTMLIRAEAAFRARYLEMYGSEEEL